MPYSITTRDGITIQNIPDHVASDAPELRERVAKIRAGQGALEAPKEGFGARLEREISSIPRQVGLTARHGIEGVTESLGVFSEPIRQGLNMIPGVNLPTAAQGGRALADTLRLPTPQSAQERIVGDASRLMAGVASFGGLVGRGSQATTGLTQQVMRNVAANPVQQITGAATAGGAMGHTRETGGGTGAQIAASLAGGLAGAAGASGVQRLGNAVGNVVANLRRSPATDMQVTLQIERALESNGVRLGDVPIAMRNQLAEEVRKARATGAEVDPMVLRRIADYGMVGATPTRGTVTLDPVLLTQERNLAKQGANSADPRLQELARLQRTNDLKLTGRLDDMGAANAPSPVGTGERLISSLKAVDAPRKDAVDAAYQAVRDSSGRYANINVPAFSQAANAALDEKMLGSVLPEKARTLLNDVSTGRLPLNVNTAVQLDKRLSGIARDVAASGDQQGALAVRQLRNALADAPLESTAGADAMRLYEQARSLAAQRFAAIDRNPAMAAALDDVAPDKFVQTFIIGNGGKANARDVLELARDLKKDPAAFNAAREQILYHLKGKALNEAFDETGNFVGNFSPTNYRKALSAIGDDKLKMFFKPAELAELKAVARVASYEKFQPTGSAINNSNTASTFAGLLEKIASNSLVSRIPFGKEAIVQPVATWSAQIRAAEALTPYNALARQPTRPTPRNALATLPLVMPKE